MHTHTQMHLHSIINHPEVQYGSLTCCLLLILCQYCVDVHRSKQC